MTLDIHTSDRYSFKQCRRRWDFSSPIRQNLTPKRSVSGIYFPLWFGTGIHHALERYYNPVLREDPVITFSAWFTKETSELTELNPTWVSENEDELHEHWTVGRGMLDFYKDYAARNDDFDVIFAEHDFSVPLWAGVSFEGRMDCVINEHGTARNGIIDHKTSVRFDEEFFVKLEMDDQCTSYMAAAMREKDVPYMGTPPDFVLYNVLRKAYPKPPTLVSKGKALSVDRANESTTAAMFEQALLEHRLIDWFEGNEKAQAYLDYLNEVGDDQFVIRHRVTRNFHEIENKWKQINAEAEDMVNEPHIYPNQKGTWDCTKCPFRAPCLATDDGSDVGDILEANYEHRIKDS